MEKRPDHRIQSGSVEGIDFNKLKMIVRNNWLWMLLIFLFTNLAAYLTIRYTKDLYESTSDLKLDIKSDASELGIKSFVEDQHVNIISGEIELLQSRLFLDRVLDSINLDVSYFSSGEVLNYEMFGSLPFMVTYTSEGSYYNTPFYFEDNGNGFTLRVGTNQQISGTYGKPVKIKDLTLKLIKNPDFVDNNENDYFFIINSRGVLLDYLSRNLSVEPLNFNANTIRISFKDNNPFKAYALVNKIDSVYLEYSYEQKNQANKQKIDWLSNELKQIELRMENFEDYFEEFTLKNRTNDLDTDLKKTIETINKIDSQRFDFTRRISGINDLNGQLESGEFFVSASQRQFLPEFVNKNLEQLQQLTLDMERLKLSYNETTFAFREKEQTLESIKKKTQEQLKELTETWVKNLEELNRRKRILEVEFAGMPDKSTQFSKNQRFYKLYEEFYLTLMQTKSEFEIAQAGSTPDFKILSPATMPMGPISPQKLMIAGIGLMASVMLNFFFIGLLYLTNNKLTSLNELEKNLDIPVLGVIPASRYLLDNQSLHIREHPKSMVSEAMRTLRTNLDFFNINSVKKIIAISSTVSGEGKSFIARNLGGIMAMSRKKVVLLDLDMRKPKPSMDNEVGKAKGISTILIRKNTWQECVGKTSIEGFDFIPSGPHPPNPSELLLNGEFAALLEELRNVYDFIILDTPPVGLVTDGIMAMKRADISIYIFRANYSKKEFITNLQRIININNFSTITALLNALPASDERKYGYGYYEEEPRKSKLTSLFKR